jgi:hypothetical protein
MLISSNIDLIFVSADSSLQVRLYILFYFAKEAASDIVGVHVQMPTSSSPGRNERILGNPSLTLHPSVSHRQR